MPKPKDGETKKDFLSRCMANEIMNNDYPDKDQRFAVCNSLWDKEKEESYLEPERRYFPITEIRALEEDSKLIIEGYPIIYEQYAEIWGFKEIIRKGAATNALKRSNELVLWDHDSGQPMAAKKNGTLEAKEDEKGVFIRADVSKTVWGRQGHEAIKNGIIDKMSFAFDVEKENWFHEQIDDDEEIEIREILEFLTLYDYSPVSYPAYEDTVVQARSKELALRNRPKPEASGEASAAALRIQAEKDELPIARRKSVEDILGYMKNK